MLIIDTYERRVRKGTMAKIINNNGNYTNHDYRQTKRH